jgi:hemolysin III
MLPIAATRAVRRHSSAEIEADFAVHVVGTGAGTIGAAAIIAVAMAKHAAVFASATAYGVALVAMLAASAAYHLRRSSQRRDLLRRLDHAAIFLMIAGTYTPFTVCILDTAAAVWLTASIWLAALIGAAVKLVFARRYEWASTLAYLALGWAGVIFAWPLFASLDRPVVTLLVAGGVIYSVGACIHRWHRLPFHDAIWHGLVLIAASFHYAAVLRGVVLYVPRV